MSAESLTPHPTIKELLSSPPWDDTRQPARVEDIPFYLQLISQVGFSAMQNWLQAQKKQIEEYYPPPPYSLPTTRWLRWPSHQIASEPPRTTFNWLHYNTEELRVLDILCDGHPSRNLKESHYRFTADFPPHCEAMVKPTVIVKAKKQFRGQMYSLASKMLGPDAVNTLLAADGDILFPYYAWRINVDFSSPAQPLSFELRSDLQGTRNRHGRIAVGATAIELETSFREAKPRQICWHELRTKALSPSIVLNTISQVVFAQLPAAEDLPKPN